MFENEIENILNIAKLRTIGYEQKIKVGNILNLHLPKSIKQFFLLESEALLGQEKVIKYNIERFDQTNLEVKKAISQLENVLKENCVFHRNEFVSLLEKAVKLQINYLFRPRWTLSRFVYKSNHSRTNQEISSLFRYFSDYTYYNDIIIGYLENKGIDNLSDTEFNKLLMKVDNAILKRYTRKEIAYMPKPLLDFINYGNKQPSNQINIDFLIIFYQDKELFGITSALKLEKEIRGKIQVTLEDLAKIIEKLDNLKLAEQMAGKEKQVESEKEYRKDAAYSHLKDNKYFLKSQLNDPQDYLNQDLLVEPKDKIQIRESSELMESIGFLRVDNKEISDLKDSEFKLEEAEDDLGIENFEQIFEENLKRKDIDVKLEDPQISENLLSRKISKSDVSSDRSRIEINITENEGKMLIKKIFNKDEEKFKKALLDLCRCSSWKEAAAYIDKIFVENDINPYSNPAIEFTNKVQIAFLSSSNNVY